MVMLQRKAGKSALMNTGAPLATSSTDKAQQGKRQTAECTYTSMESHPLFLPTLDSWDKGPRPADLRQGFFPAERGDGEKDGGTLKQTICCPP